MIMGRMLRRATLAAGALLTLAGLGAEPASAQLFWDWTGGSRENVRISSQYKKGEIIVSFGDRRLYYVSSPGQAISYPIAVPREQSRWEGVTSVTQKRVNPSWTPTPTMIAENPRLHTFLSTSDIHLEKQFRLTREQGKELAVEMVKRARS